MWREVSVLSLLVATPLWAAPPGSDTGDTGDIVVTASATAATKTDTPLVDIPQSVSVVDRRLLTERLPQTLDQALGYTAGVNVGTYGFDSRFDALFLRGFQATYTGVFRDGLRQLNSPTGLFSNEPYGIESLTIVRGPASVLYGASGAGGLVDVRSKRPTDTPFHEVEGIIGTYDRYQLDADSAGPLTADGSLSYRLTGVARDSKTQLPGYDDDRYFVAPALRFAPDDRTAITLLGEYMKSRTGGSAAYYNDADGITDIPLADPRFNDFEHRQWRAGYEATHDFGSGIGVRQNLRYAYVHADLGYSYVLDPTTDPVTRGAGVADDRVKAFTIDNQLKADVATGPLQHRVLVGVDYSHVRYRDAQGFGPVPATGEVPTPALVPTAAQRFAQTGVYAQDQITLARLGITAGIRHDWLSAETDYPAGGGLTQDDTAWTGRAAATYDLGGGVSPYLNYSTSFEPNIGLLVDGSPARPTRARQEEAGLKYQLPGRRGLITAGVFHITQRNGVVFDASSGVNQQVQLDLRSQGVELEATLRPLPGLDLTAAYAYTDVKIRRGALGTAGNTLSATPKHSASGWGTYSVTGGALRGLGLGGGLRYLGASYGNDLDTIRNGDRLFADAVAFYDLAALPGVRVQLNVTNLAGTKPVTCASGYCYRDQGRTVLGSVRYRF